MTLHLHLLLRTVAASALLIGAAASVRAEDAPQQVAQQAAQHPAPQTAQPAAAPSGQVEDIIVTAQRRSERLQEVPLAVSAFDATALQDAAVQNLTSLNGRTPNVVMEQVGAFSFASAFTIRGIGFIDVESTFEPAVGEEVDGVYLARNVGAIQDLFDIENVEVLRGPQGTLYGRNTIGGVVSLTSKRPSDDLDGEIQGTLGDYGRRDLRAAVDIPLVDNRLSARIAILDGHFDGFNIDSFNGQTQGDDNVFSGRATLLYKQGEAFDATLILDHTEDSGSGPALRNFSIPGMLLTSLGFPADTNPNPYETDAAAPIYSRLKSDGAVLQLNAGVGDLGKLTSITGLRYMSDQTGSDFGAVPFNFLNADRDESHHQISEELRLASNKGGPVDYVGGLYFLQQDYTLANFEYGELFGGPNIGSTLFAHQEDRAYAGFGQADYHILQDLTLTAGGRYSIEQKSFTIQPLFFPNSTSASNDWYDFSPKAGISYQWTPDLMTYFQYSRGFRAGGYNGRAGSFSSIGPYGSEHVETEELGVKSQFLDRHLTLNADVFTSDYANMQQAVQQVVPGTNTNQTVVANVGAAQINGAEGELTWALGDGFKLQGSVGYLRAYFTSFMADLTGTGVVTDNKGLPMTYAPRWTNNLTGTWTHDIDSLGTLTLQMSGDYQSRLYTSFSPQNATSNFAVRPDHAFFDASAGFETEDGHWRLSLWGKNLTDVHVINNVFPVATLLAAGIEMPPRTFGGDIDYKF